MEGRAAARPDRCAVRHRGGGGPPSMEGRAAARPDQGQVSAIYAEAGDLQWRAGQLPGLTGDLDAYDTGNVVLQWRAGQLPGLTVQSTLAQVIEAHLQWRAGQLPGLTLEVLDRLVGDLAPSMEGRAAARPDRPPAAPVGVVHHPSMEGRAAARPDRSGPRRHQQRDPTFNGGPGSCPA